MPLSLLHSKEAGSDSKIPMAILIMGTLSVIILGIAVWIAFPKSYGVFPLDDAYIHLVYISNLVETGTLSFNQGELSTGSSSPLWVVINAGLVVLGVPPYLSVLSLSLFMFVVVLVLTILVSRRIGLSLKFGERMSSLLGFLAGLLIAINGNIIWLSLSGMETMMFIALGLLTLLSYEYYRYKTLTGILCGLLLLTHPSGIALIAALLVVSLARGEWKNLARGLVSTVLVIMPYLLFSLLVNGDILPTTGRGKVLTYVDSGFDILAITHFIKAFIQYQSFLPQHYVLLGTILISSAVFFWVRLQGKSVADLWNMIKTRATLIYRQPVDGNQISQNVSGLVKSSTMANQ